MADIKMPRMGDAMDEGVIVQWLKKVGDKIGPEDPIMEIETDKSNVEVPADAEGYIQELLFKVGDSVVVGKTVAVVGPEPPSANGKAKSDEKPTQQEAKAAEAPEVKEPVPAEETQKAPAATNGTGPTPAPATPAPTPAPVAVRTATGFKPYDSLVGALPENLGGSASVIGEPIELESAPGNERLRATPVARAMAQVNNLDLAALRGSGTDGGITKADVEAALASGPAPSAPNSAAPAAPATLASANDGDEVEEFGGMRKIIARRMVESKSSIPHFYVSAEIDMEAMIALREQINAGAGEGQPKVSINDMLIKAAAVALTENPRINSGYGENKRVLRKSANVGFGVALEDGLIVPVVRDCQNKTVRAIARETRPLIEKARAGKLAPADYTGGTFTISNLGVMPDIAEFSAIINPGEGAILAVASTREVPAVVDGQVVARKRMKVTLSADHRVADGADGAKFLLSLKRVIENPLELVAG